MIAAEDTVAVVVDILVVAVAVVVGGIPAAEGTGRCRG